MEVFSFSDQGKMNVSGGPRGRSHSLAPCASPQTRATWTGATPNRPQGLCPSALQRASLFLLQVENFARPQLEGPRKFL